MKIYFMYLQDIQTELNQLNLRSTLHILQIQSWFPILAIYLFICLIHIKQKNDFIIYFFVT